ncbi:flagellar hook protein FlgE [Undibacterium sp.]|jgi:flagellar hook protein FlgE|uniref:flagellar hook protein FlgE n=1 Tax=Undibacterium sp. TaxID=1914977 RepID=UPI002BF98EE3|nr:flagellar hook protein FlgE [Undibacterium sp.]HTD05380.1 flagellar hook protein FlgE [Undibacterium sp.]
MGFGQGLSGLNASSKQLDVIGNNIANAQTVGFKAGQAQFADVYANSLNGAGAGQTGIGVKVATIAQQFTQGNITATSNPLDIAISGSGFFRMSDGGAITYSRNGQFQMDKNGFIVNAQNLQLTGYPVNATGQILTGTPGPLHINTNDLAPNATTKASEQINLDSREPVLDPAVVGAFNPASPATYNRSVPVDVYDTLGNKHSLQTFYVKTGPVAPATQGTWDVYATLDGQLVPGNVPAAGPVLGKIATLAFDTSGKLDPAATLPAGTVPQYSFNAVIDQFTKAAGAAAQTVSVSLASTTQFGAAFSVNALSQDGFTSGKLSKFNTGADGTILGTYTNGQTAVLGQVVLSSFTDPNGLQSIGNNQWAETAASGPPLTGVPSVSGLGSLTASATEDSNTDLTGELVNMITAQRVYQANAQTIKTQDQVLQTLVNLR